MRYQTERARAIADIKNDLYDMGFLLRMSQSTLRGDIREVNRAARRIRASVAPYLQKFDEYPNVRSLFEGAVKEIIADYQAAAERNRSLR